MDRIDIGGLMVDLLDDGEYGPDLEPSDDGEEDAIIVRNKDGIVFQMGQEFDVAKLCDEELFFWNWGGGLCPKMKQLFSVGGLCPRNGSLYLGASL